MKNCVELNQVCKSYDQFIAVDDLSIEIPAGTVFGLLGPNGAGKTSSIRMMIGITMPDRGEVRLFGEGFHREQLRNIGYLPEERGLYKKMKIIDQLIFLAELKGVSTHDTRTRAAAWCERLDLSAWLDKKVEELSKGMQQKVQFIAAMLHDPDLLILDEPFSGLDPANTVELKNVLLEAKKAGKTILFSTHRMDTVERLCDAICLIDHGKAVLKGELREVKARYGRNNVQIEYEGEPAFLDDSSLIQGSNNYGNYVEVRLQPGADAQQLLQKASATCRIQRFELMEPSLEEIFIDVVGKNGDAARRVHA
ncbi:MAG: ABC transporter ATP-binding protein [Terriglobales bacterium]